MLHHLLGRLRLRQLLELLHARLRLCLTRAGRHAHPLELAVEHTLTRRLRFLVLDETRLLLP